MLPFTSEELKSAVADGRVTARRHPTLPYTIYNYSPIVQYSNHWDDVTLNCRGLILDDDFKIVARPWKKFFNLGQVNLPMQFDDPVEVMDKADGSLGILYPIIHPEGFDVVFAIATRGSFESDQAIHGTKIYQEKYENLMPLFGYTFLFEIIYPRNRIVLDYEGMDDLILLGAVENETGYYFSPNQAKYMFVDRNSKSVTGWSGPVVKKYDFNSISDALANMGRKNAEGYVIRSHNFLVKVKEPDYLELHRLVTNCSPKTVWEQLKSGKSIDEIVSAFPDEFHSMVKGYAEPLIRKFDERLASIFITYSDQMDRLPPGADRKKIAEKFKKSPEAKYLFMLLDNRSIRDALWSELKPKEVRND